MFNFVKHPEVALSLFGLRFFAELLERLEQFFGLIGVKGSWVRGSVPEVLGDVFPLEFHIFDKVRSARMFADEVSGVIFDAFVAEDILFVF